MFESRWQHHFPASHPLMVQHTRAGIYCFRAQPFAGLYARNACNKAAGQRGSNQNRGKGDNPAFITRCRPQRGEIILQIGRIQRCHTRHHTRYDDRQKKLNYIGTNLAGVISLEKSFSRVIAIEPYISAVTLARSGVHSAFPSAQHHPNLPKPSDQPAQVPLRTQRQETKYQSLQTTSHGAACP